MQWTNDHEELLRQYNEQGFVIIREFCSAAEVRQLRDHLDDYIRNTVPDLPPMDVFCEDTSDRQQIRMLPRMQEHSDRFDSLLTSGSLPDVAKAMCGTDIVPRDTAYFNKLPHIGEATPPHQDGYYFHLDPCEALTLWLALDDVDEENGCVHYVRGSHRQGMRPHGRSQVLGFSQGILDYGTDEDLAGEVAACVSAGDLIIHDALTVHRTDPNHSPRSRRALGFVYYSCRAQVDESARERYQQTLEQELSADGKI